MPWHIETGHADCGGYAVVKDATGELVGCHPTRADARKHLAALNISESESRQEQRAGFTPNKAMRDEAARGLQWRDEFGRGGTIVGVARARDIINGRDLSLSTVNRMRSYFARHEVDKQADGFSPGEAGYPSAGRIAWALWGGDPGRSWVEDVLASVEVRQLHEDDGQLEAGDEHGLVVDIDGTLVTFDGTPRPAVVEFVRNYDGPIFVVSGRPVADRVETRKLIDSLGIDYEAIYLKTQGSTLEHKRQTVDRLMRLHGVAVAIDNDAEVLAIYSELGVEHALDPNEIKSMVRFEHARRLLNYLLH